LPKLPFMAHDGVSPTVFKFKVTHNILVAFSAFLFVWLARTSTDRRWRLVWYVMALLAALNVLLMVKGATGYVVLVALALLWGLESKHRRSVTGGLFAIAGIAAMLMLVPNPFSQRIAQIQQEIQLWRSGSPAAEATSTGQRLEYYKNTLGIIKDHPLTGVGTGGFPKAYAAQVKGTGKHVTQNPHNEFLNITAQIGIAGLVVLVAMFWLQWRSAGQLATPMEQSLARALVLTLVTGCLVNSLLLDHAEGLFYAWMSGLLYGGLKYAEPDPPTATT
jgi:O-antigen ligase